MWFQWLMLCGLGEGGVYSLGKDLDPVVNPRRACAGG